MKKYLMQLSLLAVIGAFMLSQSAQATGLFYTETTYPVSVTGAKSIKDIKYLKKGTSESKCILGLVELGDAGVEEAARQAGIKQVHFVDVHIKSIFIFFSKLTTEVYGE